jgi:hypothetical protein
MNRFWKITVGILAIIGVLGIVFAGILFYGIKTDYTYNGDDLFKAVNEHRASVGAPILELDPILCDNLVERWIAVKEPNSGHKGFDEWLAGEGIDQNPKYQQVGELYVTASTAQNAVAWWLDSPGHKSSLENKDMVWGCTYASEGTGVLMVASARVTN